ncbi:MAG: ectonucleotide pyrophosphatase/phosphodiesterase [Pseudoxanthomonas sp.]
MRSPFRLPMRPSAWLVALACGLLLCACTSTPPAPGRAASAPLLLISIDGLRADAVGRGEMPNLDALAAEGVHARWMTPSYPSLTFPNHYTLVTGLRPDHHGMIHNMMWTESLGTFRTKNPQAVNDGRWWSGAEPLWVSAEKAGLRTATMFWPGSEAQIDGARPSRWRPYDHGVSSDQRAQQVLAWFDLPAAERPRLVMMYLDQVDGTQHAFGPDSEQAHAARVQVDAALGELRQGLAARGVLDGVNIVLVSDHGFAAAPSQQYLVIEDMAAPEVADDISSGQVIEFAPRPGREAQAERQLLGRHAHYQCWRKQDLPARWHYGSNPRIPAIVCQMDEGWNAVTRERLAQAGSDPLDQGSHGYDPALPSMRATFVARGPAFRRGVEIPAFDNVDVYPLLARLLGLRPRPNDGDIAPLLPALKDPAAAR